MDWTAILMVGVPLGCTAIGGFAYVIGSSIKGDYNQKELEKVNGHIETLYERTNVHNVGIGKIETSINGMKNDIIEIKTDVKELLRST